MSGIRQIFGKEMARIFKDKKMVFSVFLLPVLIMIVIMSIVNGLVSRQQDDINEHVAQMYVINEPAAFEEVLAQSDMKFKIKEIDDNDSEAVEKAKEEILEGEADLIVEFPQGFEQMVADYQTGDDIPQVKTYQNPSENYSSSASEKVNAALETYRQQLLSERVSDMASMVVFQVNADNDEMYIQDEEKASGKAIGMMLPYFITILLFAGAMGIGTDMIAGEKERGTMASLLVSPIRRSSIVLGKVIALMVISGISSLIYVIAMVVCAPMMMGNMASMDGFSISLSPQQIIMLGALLVAIAFLYSSIIALISVFAKSVKEASTYVMPAYMLVLIVGLLTMFTSGKPGEMTYFIPFYNNALVLQGILSQEVTMVQYGITLAETLLVGAVLLGIIAKAFESEKVMAS